MYHVAFHGVGARAGDFFPLHLVVHVVRMVLTHVVVPACRASCRARDTVVDAILKVHVAHALKTLVRDDVVAKHVEILLEHRAEILAQGLRVLHEVGVYVGLQSANAVIVLYQSSAGGLLHHVEQVLTVAHAIQEGGQRREVLRACSEEQQVVVYALELVHDGADVADAV